MHRQTVDLMRSARSAPDRDLDLLATIDAGERGPRFPFFRTITLLVCTILLLSALTNRYVALSHEAGQLVSVAEGTDPIFRAIRELLAAILTLLLCLGIALRKRLLHGKLQFSPFVILTCIFFISAAISSLIRGVDPAVVLVGLRWLPFAAMLAAAPYFSSSEKSCFGRAVINCAGAFVVLEGSIALLQIFRGIPPIFGATFLGPRPYGTLVTPNVLGMAAAATLTMSSTDTTRRRIVLVALCAGVTLASGSRAALLGILLVGAGIALKRIPFRWIVLPWLAIVLAFAYSLASTETFSGRQITSEGRIDAWRVAFSENMSEPLSYLIGSGVGIGFNASRYVEGLSSSSAYADSAFVTWGLSFGLMGIAFLVVGLIHLIRITDSRRWIVLPVAGLLALTINLPEVAPANIIVTAAVFAIVRPSDATIRS